MQDEFDTMENNQSDIKQAESKRGGARPGSGRPKGKLNKVNEERQKAKERFITRVNKMVDSLFDAQSTIAQGASYLYRVDKDAKGNSKEAVIETDPNVIKDYIDGNLDNADSFYYITTERPDNKALDSMLNRAFGKPDEHVDLTSLGERLIERPKIVSPINPRHADTQTDTTDSN